jgi:hypothetical protein
VPVWQSLPPAGVQLWPILESQHWPPVQVLPLGQLFLQVLPWQVSHD